MALTRGFACQSFFGRLWRPKAIASDTLAVANRRITLELRTLDGGGIGLELASASLDDSSYRIVLTFCV